MTFEPLRVALPGKEVWTCYDGAEYVEVGLDAGDGRVVEGALGFANGVFPG